MNHHISSSCFPSKGRDYFERGFRKDNYRDGPEHEDEGFRPSTEKTNYVVRPRRTGWRIITKLQRYRNTQKLTLSHRKANSISFNLDFPYLRDNELQALFTNDNDIQMARLIRDLNIVLSSHVNGSAYLSNKLKYKVVTDLHNIGRLHAYNPKECIDEFIYTLAGLKDSTNIDSTSVSDKVNQPPSMDMVMDEQMARFGQPFGSGEKENSSANNSRDISKDPNLRIPTPEQYSKVPWPPIVGTSGFRSNLCTNASNIRPPMWKHQLEVADFCIAPQGYSSSKETLYNDGWRLATLTRDHFKTLETNRVVAPQILCVWGRLMNKRWKDRSEPTACLQIINQDDPSFCYKRLLQIWQFWLQACEVDLHSAEKIFTPVRKLDRYSLILLNFKEEKVQELLGDAHHAHDTAFDDVVRDVVSYISRFLLNNGDNRGSKITNFGYQVITPECYTGYNDSDSGFLVMHLMETYSTLEQEIMHVPLNQGDLQLRKRIIFFSQLVTSSINHLRPGVMESIATNIRRKLQ